MNIENNITTSHSTGTENSGGKKSLFKYTSMDFIESCILNGVYASRIDEVNDPFESDGIHYPYLFRICCMTSSAKKMLLWAYYTNHKECCVEFDVSEIDTSIIRPVDYIKSFSDHANMSLDEIFASLYCKGNEWSHENEYRAVYYKKKANDLYWNIVGDYVFLKAKVKSVTFGLFAERDLPRYKKALEILKQYGIQAKKCKLRNDKYAIGEDRQFDIDVELERVTEILEVNNSDKVSLTIDARLIKILNEFVKLQKNPDDAILLDDISKNADVFNGLQDLLDNGLLTLHYVQNEGNYKFYYSLTELGKKCKRR